MLRRARISLILLSLYGVVLAAHAADTTRFAGHWRGAAVDSSDGFDVEAKDLSMRFEPADEGFELEWKTPGGPEEQVEFVETTKQPGVFSAKVSKGGFLGLFSSPELNPLDGDPLVWARFAGEDTFIVYKLVIDNRGAFELDRYERTLEGDTLRLHYTRRAHGEPVRSLVARLQRSGDAQ